MTAVKSNIFSNLKVRSKFPIRHQGDGQELEAEIRDDQEQLVKLQEIIDILVAAGYFRARIKGLSSFDKVVGGMTWCIELCNIDVDVDLLFQENSTIGQRIALTEKIVAVLPKLKCPHAIEPHQIQGLDFIHIYPVVQWLIKRSMENRQEISSFVRSYAVNQFNKQFETQSENVNVRSEIWNSLIMVQEVYRPHRYYKRKTVPPLDIDSRVQITLLEYGYKGESPGPKKVNSGDQVPASIDIEQQVQQVPNNMIATLEELVHFEDLTVEEKEKFSKHYASLHIELKDGTIKSRIDSQLQVLKVKKDLLVQGCISLESHKLAKEEALKSCKTSLEEIRQKQQEADKTLKEIETYVVDNPKNMKEIEELISLNENLKSKEINFKDQCKKELIELQRLLEESRNTNSRTPTEVSLQIIKEVEDKTEKIRALRLHLAKKNRHVYALQRKLDEIPSRAELAQYQRRFIELYNQVSAKHKETKQYYTLYNTLEDTRLYMQKELSLLNSISENYPEAMKTSGGKEEFITQFQNILESVRQSKIKVEQKSSEVKQERDNLCLFLQTLIEQQRKYVTAIRQLSIEYRKHEGLLSQKRNKF